MKRLLVINFFPAFVPPSSGGELRYFNLYNRLSRHFDITLLSPTYSHHAKETVTHSASFREHRIPKQSLHDHIHMGIAGEKIAEEISALVCSYSARTPNDFHLAYLEHQVGADIIVHESPYMLDYDLLLGLDNRPRIYNSYNVESDLVSQVWKGPNAQKHVDHVTALEKRLLEAAVRCFAVSTEEIALFAKKFNVPQDRFCLVENGVDPDEFLPRPAQTSTTAIALFFGSFHPPNSEAARFIVEMLAPACPEITFQIAGSCLSPGSIAIPANVEVLGRVDDIVRRKLFASATVAINPMLSGAGTNLKALEFLAAGLPLMATPVGARGLGLVDGRHAIIVAKQDFATRLREFLGNKAAVNLKMGAIGRQYVSDHFSWDAIAARAALEINAVLKSTEFEHSRKLLVLNDFSAARPTGGGEIRINRIYSHLSALYDVTLVCLTEDVAISRVQIGERFAEIRIPKTQQHREADNEMQLQWHISAADIISYLQAPHNALLKALVEALSLQSDVIVLCHPYMVGLLNGTSPAPVIYESLNAETDLKKGVLRGHPSYKQLLEAVETCERLAIQKSAHVILVSETDRQGIQSLVPHAVAMTVVPNGVEVPRAQQKAGAVDWIRKELQGRPFLIFVGSAHPPNIEAAVYIRDTLAPQLPDCIFGLVGSVCGAMGGRNPENMILFGVVEEPVKDLIIEMADLAINPVQSGSGSNLKLADYFSKSLATITTEFGARGYAISNGEEAIVCPPTEFVAEIRNLLQRPAAIRQMGDRAFVFARKNLDWSLQANRFIQVIEQLDNGRTDRRLLVVTFRYCDPPMGGAETYLLELIRQIDRSGKYAIDVVTLDTVDITNEFHFSAKYENSIAIKSPADLPKIRVRRFSADVLSAGERLEASRRIYENWMDESRDRSMLCIEKIPNAILLGGWYFPENTATGAEIWSSQTALIRVKFVKRVSLRGYSPIANTLGVFARSQNVFQCEVVGDFYVEFDTQGIEVLELKLSNRFTAPNDPRTLGVKIREIRCINSGEANQIRLDVTNRDFLRHAAPAELVSSFIAVARRRPAEVEDAFQAIRGPQSQTMDTWLRQNAGRYAAVIGHAAPFATMVAAADCAKRAGVPLIQIPHIHADDDFYHWRRYYEALQDADISLVHPRAAIPLFFDKIGAKAEYLAFGVDTTEKPTTGDEAQFQTLYGSDLPYFVVLGRKDPTKNYRVAIDAIRQLNAGTRVCNLVMIGRDEDQEPLSKDDVVYLGSQPRGVVLAALKKSAALITMSDSESFGIVVLEAWSQGTPVIASETCHASVELIENGRTGLLANSGNLHVVAAKLLKNPGLAKAMGACGREVCAADYSWKAIGNRLLNLIDKVVDNHGSKQRITTDHVR